MQGFKALSIMTVACLSRCLVNQSIQMLSRFDRFRAIWKVLENFTPGGAVVRELFCRAIELESDDRCRRRSITTARDRHSNRSVRFDYIELRHGKLNEAANRCWRRRRSRSRRWRWRWRWRWCGRRRRCWCRRWSGLY